MSMLGGMNVVNNGLDLVYDDKGMGECFVDESLNGVFKVFFLCNIELMVLYMYDGCFEMFEEVIEYYSMGICVYDNFVEQLRELQGIFCCFNFSDEEKVVLFVYLKMVMDEFFVEDVCYFDLFKQ